MTAQRKSFLFDFDLQLFAGGEKTEKATSKKREEARKKGQVLQSREITSALLLIFIFLAIKVFGQSIYSEISSFYKRIFTQYVKLEDLFTTNGLSRIFSDFIAVLFKTTAPILAVAMFMGLAASYAQVGFLFTTETLKMNFDRINPLNGLKRVFSARSLVELVKSIFKVSVIGYVAYSYINGEVKNILNLMNMDVMNIGAYIAGICLNVAIRICVVLIILGVLDYIYQWWDHEKNLKMTKEEVKEEYKQTEGNPEIKSKIKQKQRQISMRRMLHEVPKADVIITNPTHYSVAVKYDESVSSAPVVVAKGQDYIALRIREVAKEHKVEIVENRVVARTLYNTVDIGEKIPPELYQAVAEILAFVYKLKGKAKVAR